MSIFAKIADAGITLRRSTYGHHRTTCPNCSHTRTKKRDPCLSIDVASDKALFICWHCGHKGAIFDEEVRGPVRPSARAPRRAWDRRRGGRSSWAGQRGTPGR